MKSFKTSEADKLQPLVSVIIPNYNNEKYLTESIKSVLSQTYKNIEIIICDDHSTDNSADILDTYSKDYNNISVVYNENNKGVSYTRNHAIKASNGEYITSLDSDDIYYSNEKIENEMKLILFYKNAYQRDICAYSNTASIDLQSQFIQVSTPGRARKEGDILMDILSRSCFIPRDFTIKKSYYYNIGSFDQSLTVFEDWDFKIRLANILPFYYTAEFGTGYRLHDNGLSSSHKKDKKIVVLMKIFEKYLYMLPHKRDKMLAISFFKNFLLTRFDQKNMIESYIDQIKNLTDSKMGII